MGKLMSLSQSQPFFLMLGGRYALWTYVNLEGSCCHLNPHPTWAKRFTTRSFLFSSVPVLVFPTHVSWPGPWTDRSLLLPCKGQSTADRTNFWLVMSSAKVFSCRGLHWSHSRSLALASKEDNCMLMSMGGHLVELPFLRTCWLPKLSVPAANSTDMCVRWLLSSKCPNTTRAAKVASSCACPG